MTEQNLCPLCDGEHLEACHIDGDWEVRFYLDSCLILTSVIAGSQEQAIRFANNKIEQELGIELEPDETVVSLVGVYQ